MTLEELLMETNNTFYKYMRSGDYPGMADLWARQRTVSCTHPGRAMLVGLDAVLESWRMILGANPPAVWPDHPRAVITGSTAFVLNVERIAGSELMASNGFAIEDGEWRMINHQAAYMPAENASDS
ncbi:MAG: nuclear transport factor 2 family protein [Pseudomonadota bacterium]